MKKAADESKRFEFLEHTADAYVAAYGTDLAEAFENAAAAMFEVMTDVEKVGANVEDDIEVFGFDEYALLYNWLEALLIKFETQEKLYSKFRVQSLTKLSGRYRLRADIWGEKYDPRKHASKVGIKAITYHQMEIIKEQNKTTLKFVLDI